MIPYTAQAVANGDDNDVSSHPWLDLAVEDERWTDEYDFLAALPHLVAASLSHAGLMPQSNVVSIALVSDDQICALNRDFRGKDQPTNVLSFPAADIPVASVHSVQFLGDIAIAYDITKLEASHEGKLFAHHASHLVVHGVLHLLDFDHDRDESAERMEEAERTILSSFLVPDPYSQPHVTQFA